MSAIQAVAAPLVNSPLVQAVAERDADVGRAQNQFGNHVRAELHRQDAETVHEITEADQQGVDEDGHNSDEQHSRDRRRDDNRKKSTDQDHWRMGVDNDGKEHLINVVG